MKYWFANGELKESSTRGDAGGFLVIYKNIANYSLFDSVSHDDLLEAIASRNRFDKTDALSDGIRLFFAFTKDGVVISGTRKIDNETIAADPAGYAKIIRTVLK